MANGSVPGHVESGARGWMSLGLACALLVTQDIASAAGSRFSLRPSTPGSTAPTLAPPEGRPGYALLPADDDWSWLDTYDGAADPYDRTKRIALDAAGRVRLSTSALAYLEYERYVDDDFGRGPADDDYANTRLNLYAALELGERWRLFGALKHGAKPGAEVPPSPVARDDGDLHQAFVEVAFGDAFGRETADAMLRLGRFELHYGAGRMITVREGPNLRGDHDGVQGRFASDAAVTDLFAVRDVAGDVGAFDNETGDDALWGLYSSRRPSGRWLGKPEAFDLYYIGERALDRPFAGGAVDEIRHSIGLRHYTGGGPGWSTDTELTLQYAVADDGTEALAGAESGIAWSASGDAGYAWDTALQPSITVSAGVSSGDDDPADDRIGTFRAPNPPGRFFGDTSPFGPGNLAGLAVVGSLSPRSDVTVEIGTVALWRLRVEDATYTPANRIAVGSAGTGRWVGAELGLGATWTIDRHWSASAAFAHFVADGRYLADNDASEDITRLNLAVDFRF